MCITCFNSFYYIFSGILSIFRQRSRSRISVYLFCVLMLKVCIMNVEIFYFKLRYCLILLCWIEENKLYNTCTSALWISIKYPHTQTHAHKDTPKWGQFVVWKAPMCWTRDQTSNINYNVSHIDYNVEYPLIDFFITRFPFLCVLPFIFYRKKSIDWTCTLYSNKMSLW